MKKTTDTEIINCALHKIISHLGCYQHINAELATKIISLYSRISIIGSRFINLQPFDILNVEMTDDPFTQNDIDTIRAAATIVDNYLFSNDKDNFIGVGYRDLNHCKHLVDAIEVDLKKAMVYND